MEMIKCQLCKNKMPKQGQCNKCGFLDNPKRIPPIAEDFVEARKVNKEAKYSQFDNLDMRVIDL